MNYLVGVMSEFIGLKYYQIDQNVKVGDLIAVSTPYLNYLTPIAKLRRPLEKEENDQFDVYFPKIIRIANKEDESNYKNNLKKAKEIVEFTQIESNKLNLGMKVLNAYFDIEESKILITFTAEGRVDFRELVKILTPKYRARIELRQIGARDYAQVVGGIGQCGLPLCCSVFIKEFATISINMAKNQLLVPSIPKLSGQCGKLFCCLKYEDDDYSSLIPTFPEIGFEFNYHNQTYKVSSLNVLTGTIFCTSDNSNETFTKEEFERVKQGKEKLSMSSPSLKDINDGVDLSGEGFIETNKRNQEAKFENIKIEKFINHKDNNNNKSHKPFNKNKHFDKNNKFNKDKRFNKNRHNNFNNSNNSSNNSSGFIKVSSIEDKSVLDFNPNKKSNDEN